MADAQPEVAAIQINDAVFCSQHVQEVCDECDFDGRQENDAFFGVKSSDRAYLDVPESVVNMEGLYQCKKHGAAGDWKKQITKLQKEAKKAGKNF
ncbi:hypothetical protein CPB85DRAFT_1436695 [Mucidula mucida]|nr:hypothetical protein CPB85DRAFT_1436695 [Mucidula mucida]